jgi:hypothetical protein
LLKKGTRINFALSLGAQLKHAAAPMTKGVVGNTGSKTPIVPRLSRIKPNIIKITFLNTMLHHTDCRLFHQENHTATAQRAQVPICTLWKTEVINTVADYCTKVTNINATST